MNTLAPVEVHLVMHGLEARERLLLARCNRSLMIAASSPFAWQRVMIHVQSSKVSASKIQSSMLLRHASISLRWIPPNVSVVADPMANGSQSSSSKTAEVVSSSYHPCSKQDRYSHVTALLWFASCCRLRRFDCSEFADQLTSEDWQRIFTHSSMRSLREIILHKCECEVGLPMIKLLAALPYLHSLTFTPTLANASSSSSSSISDSTKWSALASAPALTSIHVKDSYSFQSSSILPHLASHCRRLKKLHVNMPSLYGEAFLTFFSTTIIQNQLESLTLEFFYFDGNLALPGISSIDLARSFAGLRRLRSLHLIRCGGLDRLIPHLLHVSSLRHVNVTLSYERDFNILSPAVIAHLMILNPFLSFKVIIKRRVNMGLTVPTEEAIRMAAEEAIQCNDMRDSFEIAHVPELQQSDISNRYRVMESFERS